MQHVHRRNSAFVLREGRPSRIPEHNFTEALPPEMSVQIFSELDLPSLCSASLTCKQWNGIIEGNDRLWRSHCLSALAVCRRELDGDRRDGLSWKITLVRNYQKGCVKKRWLKGRYSNIRSAEDLPRNSMCPLDVETWGEILEAELERMWRKSNILKIWQENSSTAPPATDTDTELYGEVIVVISYIAGSIYIMELFSMTTSMVLCVGLGDVLRCHRTC